jgi:hypothetical protein
MLHHFTHQHLDGRWHCVYRVPGTDTLASVMDAEWEQPCTQEALRLNRLQARQHEAAMALNVPHAERRIPAGFYNNNDAA